MYDLIIIGAGPAGMTAAIYAARRKIKFIIISLDIGGQMSWSSEIENYPGTTHASGVELTRSFQEHVKVYGINIKTEEVSSIVKKEKAIFVRTKKRVYESKTVIIASGKSPRKLNALGEERFLGKGLSYCAACDAPLYKDKKVVVVGGGNSGLGAALFLSKYAKKVYILEMLPKLGGEPYLKDKVLQDKKISVIAGAKIKEIFGKKFISGFKYEKDKIEKTLDVDGIFVEIGLVTKVDFVKVKKNKWGEIMIFRSTKTHDENLTSIPGIFAAGDVTDIPTKQIVAAAGEGCKAALAAFDYIHRWK
ncbi:FAD-dependent oxidoreductase [Candidatus Pacearchaeota archaeon]|nr:FAD-dependent oxidoreductase [Candidatus Pacearchaeota archaeon]